MSVCRAGLEKSEKQREVLNARLAAKTHDIEVTLFRIVMMMAMMILRRVRIVNILSAGSAEEGGHPAEGEREGRGAVQREAGGRQAPQVTGDM